MRPALFDQVEFVLDEAITGRPRALTVLGERGAGKSWVAEQASALAAERGMRVLSTRGRPDDRELAFGAMQALLRPLERHLDDLAPEHADDIRGALAFRTTAIDPLQLRVGVFRLLCAAAETTPVCVVVDDADLIDRASADVLSFALGRLGADPVAAVAAARHRSQPAARMLPAPSAGPATTESVGLSSLSRFSKIRRKFSSIT